MEGEIDKDTSRAEDSGQTFDNNPGRQTGAAMMYRLLILITAMLFVGFVAYLHSGYVADTLLAMAVFSVISIVVFQPSRDRGSSKD
ncbi:MAG: hypothetical protein V3S51_03350 [Dehalococcoidia bacterium]